MIIRILSGRLSPPKAAAHLLLALFGRRIFRTDLTKPRKTLASDHGPGPAPDHWRPRQATAPSAFQILGTAMRPRRPRCHLAEMAFEDGLGYRGTFPEGKDFVG